MTPNRSFLVLSKAVRFRFFFGGCDRRHGVAPCALLPRRPASEPYERISARTHTGDIGDSAISRRRGSLRRLPMAAPVGVLMVIVPPASIVVASQPCSFSIPPSARRAACVH
jgi:hypothetical protein